MALLGEPPREEAFARAERTPLQVADLKVAHKGAGERPAIRTEIFEDRRQRLVSIESESTPFNSDAQVRQEIEARSLASE